MPSEFMVLFVLAGLAIGMIGVVIYLRICQYYEPRFSPMGPWPSEHEERQQKIRDSKASYKEEYKGAVPVKCYRWSGEKMMLLESGKATIHVGYKTVRYRKEFDSDEWIVWEEKIDTKTYVGNWRRTY